MSRRSHYSANGEKISYGSYEEARDACLRRRPELGHLEPYLCERGEDCGWHIGRNDANKRGRELWEYDWPHDELELGTRVARNLKMENRGAHQFRVQRLEQRGRRAGTGKESRGRNQGGKAASRGIAAARTNASCRQDSQPAHPRAVLSA